MNDEVRSFAVSFFEKCRVHSTPPRFACPRQCLREMENAMKDQDFLFSVSDLPKYSQLVSLFGRLEQLREQGKPLQSEMNVLQFL